MNEIDVKVERVARLAADRGLRGIVLLTQPNFAWLTAGQSNRIDGSREQGAGALVIGADGRRVVVASAIEMPRLTDEALAGLGFEPVEVPWTAERANPTLTVDEARRALGGGPLGADMAAGEAVAVDAALTRARVPLTDAELERYRALGRDTAAAVGGVCRALRPGLEEREVERLVATAMATIGARPVVLLIGADARLARYRHPVPTALRWQHTLMVVVCAERQGLVCALTRLVSAGPVAADLHARTHAAATVFARLVAATRPGVSGRTLFGIAAAAYRETGYAGEEHRHHQGGAIGYRSRDWIAHPGSDEVVQLGQAFAWNPSVAGTKLEETIVLAPEGSVPITADPTWPALQIDVDDRSYRLPDILPLG
jgi:Xaa-Pro aminopeptidase